MIPKCGRCGIPLHQHPQPKCIQDGEANNFWLTYNEDTYNLEAMEQEGETR